MPKNLQVPTSEEPNSPWPFIGVTLLTMVILCGVPTGMVILATWAIRTMMGMGGG